MFYLILSKQIVHRLHLGQTIKNSYRQIFSMEMLFFLALLDALEVMSVTYTLTSSLSVIIDLTDVTLVSEDEDYEDYDDPMALEM